MSFTEFWKKTPLPADLIGLDMNQIEAVRRLMLKAYNAGRKTT